MSNRYTSLFSTHKIKILIFIIFLSFSSNASAQHIGNPGYLGKHFIISGEGNFGGSFYYMKNFWIKYGVSTEFILKPKLSLGISYMHSSSNISASYTDDCYTYNHFMFNTHEYGLDIYIYSKGLSPLGKFYRIQFAYLTNYSDDFFKNGTLLPNKDPYSCRGYTSDRITSSNLRFSFFIGKKRVFYNAIVVSYGVQFGLTLLNPLTMSIWDVQKDFTDDNASETANERLFSRTASNENFYSSFINFKVGIGFIAI